MKSPAFSFYVRDWLCSKTVSKLHSKPLSKGVSAYLYLLCSAWLEDPPATLPNDDDLLAGYARLSRAEWDALKPDLMHQFTLNSFGRLVNLRLMAEWEKQSQRRSAGSKGGSKRVANLQAKPQTAHEDEDEDENGIRKGTGKGDTGKGSAPPDQPPKPEPLWPLLMPKINTWFHRRDSTEWSDKEMKSLMDISKRESIAEEVEILGAYYLADIPESKNIRRRDLQTLLNNWTGEVDRARHWQKSGGQSKPPDNALF